MAITAGKASQLEGSSGSTLFNFIVNRSSNTTGSTVVSWAVSGTGSNPAGAADFTGNILPSGTLTFTPGQSQKTISVAVKGDAAVEANETFAVSLSNPSGGATLTTASAIGTITNDDPQVVTLAVSDASAGETANPGSFTLSRSGPATSALTVNLALGGTATNGSDYLTIKATATFIAGASTALVSLTPIDDLLVEGQETVNLSVLAGAGYRLGPAVRGSLTLADNDQNGTNAKNTLTGDQGSNALNGLGGDDALDGAFGDDRLNGGLGKDTLIGGGGTDVYVYGSLADSLLAGFDLITDYATWETIDAPSSVVRSSLSASRGTATALTAAALQTLLSPASFPANSARAFQVTGESGTFVAFNNGRPGFQAATDGLLHLPNFTISATNPIQIV